MTMVVVKNSHPALSLIRLLYGGRGVWARVGTGCSGREGCDIESLLPPPTGPPR